MRRAVSRTLAGAWMRSRSPTSASAGAFSGPGPTLVVMNGSIHQFSVCANARPLSWRNRATAASRAGLRTRFRPLCIIRLRLGAMAPDQNGVVICMPKAVIASSRLATPTPQGALGASNATARTGMRAATSWTTRPPREWPIRIGGSGSRAQKAAT